MPCYQSTNLPGGVTTAGRTAYQSEADCLQACKEGACCEGGTCSVKPQCQCQGTGKTFKGVGTTCTPGRCDPVVCTDCCAGGFLSQSQQQTIPVSLDMSWAIACGGVNYSASFAGTVTARNTFGGPFGPLNSPCIFIAGSEYGHFSLPQNTAICSLLVVVEARVTQGQCVLVPAIDATMKKTGGWTECAGVPFTGCGSAPGIFTQWRPSGQSFSVSTGGCMEGISFSGSSVTAAFGSEVPVTVSGTISIPANPLP